jgi:hypothetical protein
MGIFDRFTGASEESEELLKEIRALSQDNLVLAESYSALARATLEFDEKGAHFLPMVIFSLGMTSAIVAFLVYP